MNEIYPENILDHGMNPRNRGVLDPADAESEADYPRCGDTLQLTLRLDENQRITAVGWGGDGCAISMASASMLGEEIIGKSVDEVRQISKQHIFEMLGIPLSQNRVKCALLSLQVLTVALYGEQEWRKHQAEDENS
jgi:nitrogen fixation NifU-like protein